MTFHDYQTDCIDRIQQRHLAPDHLDFQATVLRANVPFAWQPPEPTKHAVIFIHGLFDSPCVFHSFIPIFQNQHYLIRSVLLPGHGTCPEDLLNICFEQWLSASQAAIDSLPDTIERIVLCGFSTGATLSHVLAAKKANSKLAGIVSIAPALRLHPIQRWLLNNKILVALAKKLGPWYFQSPTMDYARYTKHAINAADQIQRLINACPKKSPTIPVFHVLSASDRVIDSAYVWHLFQKTKGQSQSRCLIYSSAPLQFPDDPRISVRSSSFPAQSIKNFSHICLSIAPDHWHYGSEGDYTLSLPKPAKLIKGEAGGQVTQRLTYNPDFAFMANAISEFLSTL